MNYINASDFIHLSRNIPVVDVRSPGEFTHGHITHAHNIPLFNDEERAEVGTIYHQYGRDKAMNKGMEIAGPKKETFVHIARQIAFQNKLLVHCWRGGMRSEKMALLFEESGIACQVLTGGYKNYRNQLFEDFNRLRSLIILHGKTGSGKTEILKIMGERGEQVIDLERYAHHKGSAFGSIGLREQPTSMQFQNDVHDCLMNLDTNHRIWVEGESLNIGKVYLPNTLWDSMCRSTVIKIEIPKEKRIERIINEYGGFQKELLLESINKLRKRYGGDKTQDVIHLVATGRLHESVGRLLDYYDMNYNYSLEKYNSGNIIGLESSSGEASVNADLILNQANHLQFHE